MLEFKPLGEYESEVLLKKDFRAFVLSSKEQWKKIVGGGVVFLLMGVAASVGFSVPKTVAGTAAFCFAVALACFLAFRDKCREVEKISEDLKKTEIELQRKRELDAHNRPNLDSKIEVVATGLSPHGPFVMVQASVYSIGSPSLATDYEIAIIKNGERKLYRPAIFEDGNCVNTAANEALFEKTEDAIAQGCRVRGFLWTHHPDLAGLDAKNDDWKVEIEFKDVAGRIYIGRMGDTLKQDDLNVAFPRIGNPIVKSLLKIKPPSPTPDMGANPPSPI